MKYIAIVKNINDPKMQGSVQVSINGITNGFNDNELPWAIITHSPQEALTNGIGFSHHCLQVGSQVIVEQTDNFQTWFVTHCIPAIPDKQQINNVNDYVFVHPSGMKITLKDNSYIINHPKGGVLTITEDNKLHVKGFVKMIVDDETIFNKPVIMNSTLTGNGAFTSNGQAFVNNTLNVTDVITSNTDVKAQSISLVNHLTSNVYPGSGTSGKPI